MSELSLSELIERYGNNYYEAKSYEKQINADKDEIKKRMLESTIGESDSDTYVVTLTDIKIEDFDNDKLVAKLKSLWAEEHGSMENPYLKLVYVPDMEAIERAIYDNELNPNDLIDCKIVKHQNRMNIKKKGKSK